MGRDGAPGMADERRGIGALCSPKPYGRLRTDRSPAASAAYATTTRMKRVTSRANSSSSACVSNRIMTVPNA